VNPHAYVYGFKAGAQTILDNPQEWGLVRQGSFNKKNLFKAAWKKRAKKTITALELIVKKYEDNRIVLDAGLETALEMEMYLLAKESLKQNDNEQVKRLDSKK